MNFFLRVEIMNKKLLIIIFLILPISCQSIKDGLSGKKYESSDEFLVIKKNPLVLPPDFNELPKPEDPVSMSREESIEAEIDDIVSSMKSEKDLEIMTCNKSSGGRSIPISIKLLILDSRSLSMKVNLLIGLKLFIKIKLSNCFE